MHLRVQRLKHLKERGRSDAPINSKDFAGRDKRELSIGISEAIALADETISNNDLTLVQLKQRACSHCQKNGLMRWSETLEKAQHYVSTRSQS